MSYPLAIHRGVPMMVFATDAEAECRIAGQPR